MDPIAVLLNRIEQLEAKLGVAQNGPIDGQKGDSATENLLNVASAVQNATAGYEKLAEATQRASELNNYTEPNFIEKVQENEMHKQEVVAAEPVIRHHCQCMHRCKQIAPVLESEKLTEVPQMQNIVDTMHTTAADVKQEADNVSDGVQQLAETCGLAASNASEQLANIAKKIEQVEEKKCPQRRNGLD